MNRRLLASVKKNIFFFATPNYFLINKLCQKFLIFGIRCGKKKFFAKVSSKKFRITNL
jgi:hypothetical protein